METETVDIALRRLVCGMADQDIKADKPFFYDGGRLLAEDVATLGMPSMLCLAGRLSEKLGLGSLGYRFELSEAAMGFPLKATRDAATAPRAFSFVGPLLYDVFMSDVRECRLDLARLFERAARVIDPEFRLATDTAYYPVAAAPESADAEAANFDLG
jgi:hypothetical protein